MTSTAEALDKARRLGERTRIEQLVSREESRVRSAFRRFVDDVRSPEVRRQVRLALEREGIEAALRVVDAHVARMGTVLTTSFIEAAGSELPALLRQMGRAAAGVAIAFDPSDPRAAFLMRTTRLEFVREFSRAQREATRAALVDALQSGAGPIQASRAFRDSIGLTSTQRDHVINYRRALETGDAAALERGLRDRRFDPSVRRLLENDEPLGARRINRMVERYRTRYIQYRAETIARTETLVAVNRAREEAASQLAAKLELPSSAVVRTWRSTRDSRVRDTHAAMDGQVRAMGDPFVSPRGARLMHPGDRSLGAPGSEVVNCRCVLTTRIDSGN